MATHANTLYVQTAGAYLGKQGETVRVRVDGRDQPPGLDPRRSALRAGPIQCLPDLVQGESL